MGAAGGSRSQRFSPRQQQLVSACGAAPLPPPPTLEDGTRLVGAVHALLSAGPLGPRITPSPATARAVLVVEQQPHQSLGVKKEVAAQGDKEEPMDEGAEATTPGMEEGEKEEVDVGWLVGVLPSHLLTLITSRSPSPAFANRRAVMEGMEVLSALVAAAGEVPSVAQRLATSASAFVDLLLCLLVWHVTDYCEEPSRADHDDDDDDDHRRRENMIITEDNREREEVVPAGTGGNGASVDGRGANGQRSTAVGRAAATLSSALKAELLRPRPDGWDEGGYVEQPLLDAVLGHEKLDDIIGAFVDSLRVLLHHYQHAPTPTVAEEICEVVEALYLLCFSDDFAGRLMSHRLFPEGHVLLALAHVLALPDAGEAVLASGLGLLAILCEKQQPEFLAIAHLQPPIHAIINTLITLATDYLQKLGQQGKEGEASGAGTTASSAAHMYTDATHRRIFHSIELFADHPRYKTALIRPGAEVLWGFLGLPTDVFGAFLKDPNRRPIAMHLLHLLISLALPCPTASWEDITGGQAAQGHAMLVSALRGFCAQAPSSIKPAEGGERMVANLARVVGTLYEADNIHFPVEHFLTLHMLTAALHSALANPVGLATSATDDNTAPFVTAVAADIEAERQIKREPDRLNQEELKPKQGEDAWGPQEKGDGGEAAYGGSMKLDAEEPRAEKRDHQAMALIADPSPGLIGAVRPASSPGGRPADDGGGGSAINHNTENGAIGSNEETTVPKDPPPKKPKREEADTRNGK